MVKSNGQVNQQAIADRPVSFLLKLKSSNNEFLMNDHSYLMFAMELQGLARPYPIRAG